MREKEKKKSMSPAEVSVDISVDMPYCLSTDEVFAAYQTSKKGLGESECAKRLLLYGPNDIQKEDNNVSFLMRFLLSFKEPLIALLLSPQRRRRRRRM